METTERLFWNILNASDEDALHEVVKNNPSLNNDKNWYPYGGTSADDRSNFSTFENQQPSAVPALVEKITNSIDALLMKECLLRGVDPKSLNAPQCIAKAVEEYFGIKNGDFSEVSHEDRRSIAEKVQIIATGDKTSPNIIIYDEGEGQHPDDFDKTFLSLHKRNKADIHFVQGKYNMGSTGAVVFCGKHHRYQLIASKRHDKLNSNLNNDFGFTLVRRHPLSEEQEEQYRTSWYEYFRPNAQIPRFSINNIDIGLWKDKLFTAGSIVKLYSYQLPRGSRSNINLDLWCDLNQYLYLPALPILLYEKRFSSGKAPSKLMLGNKTRIVIDDREKKEETISMSISSRDIGRVDVEATVFKYGVKRSDFIGEMAVTFTLNGQTQGFLRRSFISQDLGLPMLRDFLLIHVDCTKIKTNFRQDLFMANRCDMKESEAFQTLRDELSKTIKSNETLKELNQRRKNRIMHESEEDRDLLKSLLESMPIDNDLLKLLKKHGDLNIFRKRGEKPENIEKENKEREKKPYVSQRYPSIFKIDLKEDPSGKKIKSIPLNGKGIIKFETNVEDEYLFRPKDRGEFQIQILGIKNNNVQGGNAPGKPNKVEDIFEVTTAGPTNNTIKVVFEPKSDVSVGDEISLCARLTAPQSDLESIFHIKIVDPVKEAEKQKEANNKTDQPSLPTPIKVYDPKKKSAEKEVDWDEFGWTGDDIVKVVQSEKGGEIVEAIAINMDSYVVTRYISKNQINSEEQIRFIKNKFFCTVYLHSLFLYGILYKMNSARDNDQKLDIEELLPLIFKPYGQFLLYSSTDDAILSSLNE